MKSNTKKLTYAAVSAALAVVGMLLAYYLPLMAAPLLITSLCIYIAFDKGGIVYGFLCTAACIGIMFAIGGLSPTFILMAVIFIPYGIMAYFMRKLRYNRPLTVVIRILIVLAFSAAVSAAIYFLAEFLLIDIAQIAVRFGGYYVLAIIFAALMLLADFLFRQMCLFIAKTIK